MDNITGLQLAFFFIFLDFMSCPFLLFRSFILLLLYVFFFLFPAFSFLQFLFLKDGFLSIVDDGRMRVDKSTIIHPDEITILLYLHKVRFNKYPVYTIHFTPRSAFILFIRATQHNRKHTSDRFHLNCLRFSNLRVLLYRCPHNNLQLVQAGRRRPTTCGFL